MWGEIMDLKDLKAGDVVWECQGGHNIKMTIKEDAIDDGEGYSATGVTVNGSEILLYYSYGCSHYGPRLYETPQYISLNKDFKGEVEDWDNSDSMYTFIDEGETY